MTKTRRQTTRRDSGVTRRQIIGTAAVVGAAALAPRSARAATAAARRVRRAQCACGDDGRGARRLRPRRHSCAQRRDRRGRTRPCGPRRAGDRRPRHDRPAGPDRHPQSPVEQHLPQHCARGPEAGLFPDRARARPPVHTGGHLPRCSAWLRRTHLFGRYHRARLGAQHPQPRARRCRPARARRHRHPRALLLRHLPGRPAARPDHGHRRPRAHARRMEFARRPAHARHGVAQREHVAARLGHGLADGAARLRGGAQASSCRSPSTPAARASSKCSNARGCSGRTCSSSTPRTGTTPTAPASSSRARMSASRRIRRCAIPMHCRSSSNCSSSG